MLQYKTTTTWQTRKNQTQIETIRVIHKENTMKCFNTRSTTTRQTLKAQTQNLNNPNVYALIHTNYLHNPFWFVWNDDLTCSQHKQHSRSIMVLLISNLALHDFLLLHDYSFVVLATALVSKQLYSRGKPESPAFSSKEDLGCFVIFVPCPISLLSWLSKIEE